MLEGNWIMVSGEQDGQAIPEDELQKSRLVIAGNQHTVTWAEAELQGTHELDTSQTPMTIDATDTAGPFEGMFLKGICQFLHLLMVKYDCCQQSQQHLPHECDLAASVHHVLAAVVLPSSYSIR